MPVFICNCVLPVFTFSFESALSGVGKSINPNDKMWYRRSFKLPNNWSGKDVVIHFEAVDYKCALWVNDILVGTHKGGFDRFSFNITSYLKSNGSQNIEIGIKVKLKTQHPKSVEIGVKSNRFEIFRYIDHFSH